MPSKSSDRCFRRLAGNFRKMATKCSGSAENDIEDLSRSFAVIGRFTHTASKASLPIACSSARPAAPFGHGVSLGSSTVAVLAESPATQPMQLFLLGARHPLRGGIPKLPCKRSTRETFVLVNGIENSGITRTLNPKTYEGAVDEVRKRKKTMGADSRIKAHRYLGRIEVSVMANVRSRRRCGTCDERRC